MISLPARVLVAIAFVISIGWTTASAQTNTKPNPSAKSSPFSVARDAILRRAQVWIEPATPIEQALLGVNPAGSETFAEEAIVPCRFKPGGIAGSTPKFECELANGKKVKVKYGVDNPEVYAEVAATRLLGALGFPTDQMYVVKRVRCLGCPKNPFERLQCLNDGTAASVCFAGLDFTRTEDFEHPVIEHTVGGKRIETRKERGWAWKELNKIDPAAGGASREQVDALRLMAVFLADWDNKAKNQRLTCLDERKSSSKSGGDMSAAIPRCRRPLAMVQDLGGTFGPEKVDLKRWSRTPVWSDPSTCAISMKDLPYGGSTFPDVRITEGGRAFLAARLGELSTRQIRELFEGARITAFPHPNPDQHDVNKWVQAFEDKVRAITDRAPCPDVT